MNIITSFLTDTNSDGWFALAAVALAGMAFLVWSRMNDYVHGYHVQTARTVGAKATYAAELRAERAARPTSLVLGFYGLLAMSVLSLVMMVLVRSIF